MVSGEKDESNTSMDRAWMKRCCPVLCHQCPILLFCFFAFCPPSIHCNLSSTRLSLSPCLFPVFPTHFSYLAVRPSYSFFLSSSSVLFLTVWGVECACPWSACSSRRKNHRRSVGNGCRHSRSFIPTLVLFDSCIPLSVHSSLFPISPSFLWFATAPVFAYILCPVSSPSYCYCPSCCCCCCFFLSASPSTRLFLLLYVSSFLRLLPFFL